MRLRLLGALIEVRGPEGPAFELLRELWWPFAAGDAGGEPAATFEIEEASEGWRLRDHRTPTTHPDLWGLFDSLRYLMLEVADSQPTHLVSLHAAALRKGAATVVLAGRSGTGKTTLTLALLAGGWAYLSDDVVPIDPATGEILPFPKPLGVKDPGRWRDVRESFGGLPETPVPAGAFLVPPRGFEVVDRRVRPTHLVFPEYSPGVDPEIEDLSPGRAAALATAFVRRLDPPAVAALTDLSRAVRSFRIVYGESAAPVAALGALAAGSFHNSPNT